VRLNVALYRVMAYVTGVVLIVLCVLAVLQPFVADQAAVSVLGLVHGTLYIVYLLVAFALSRRLRLGAWPTAGILLAGTVPVMTFVVERRISHRYIGPALAGHGSGPESAGAAAGLAGPASGHGGAGRESVPPQPR
jgi:integral membrane protein